MTLFRRLFLLLLFGAATVGLSACSKGKDQGPAPIPWLESEMVLVPAGEFIMGSDKVDNSSVQQEFGLVKPLYIDEHPQHTLQLDAFLIDKYEVTNKQYKRFVEYNKYEPPLLWIQNGYNVRPEILQGGSVESLRVVAAEYFKLDKDTTVMDKETLLKELFAMQEQRDRLPVAGISWYDASSYCKWVGKRLPYEAEWEKAARGAHGLEYPWGDQWEPTKTNTGEDIDGDEVLKAVGSYPQDKSPYGVYDLAGNVSEWVNDWYRAYPGSTYSHETFGDIHKVIRGGGAGMGHYALSAFFRGARRSHADPSTTATDVGFRCAQQL